MSLIVRGVNIAETDTCTWQGNPVTKIIYKGDTVWEHTSSSVPTIPKFTQGLYLNLGWDASPEQDFDCDLWIFKLDSNGKLISINDMIYFGNLESSDGDVGILLDNKTGAGEGDDEKGWIDYTKISSDVRKVVVAAAIWDAEARGQNFGQISNCYFSATNAENQEEIINYILTEDFSVDTAVIMLEVYRQGTEWLVNVLGESVDGVQGLLDRFDTGLSVNDLVKPE